jgi:hypothetical protein
VCALPSLFHLIDIPEMIVVQVIVALEVGMAVDSEKEGASVIEEDLTEMKTEVDSVMVVKGMNLIILLRFLPLSFVLHDYEALQIHFSLFLLT